MSDTRTVKTRAMIELEASHHLDLAAFHLYMASQVRFDQPLPSWDSKDAEDMRRETRYLVKGALKRGDKTARLAVVERVAVVLATANGDIWPQCDNQIHRGLSEERRAVLAAMRRQRYRHQSRLVTAMVARFYEIDQDVPAMLEVSVLEARAQEDADKKLVADYRGKIGMGEVVSIGGVRE